jgi:hypothetical protein
VLGLRYAMELMGMAAEHIAYLRPPPPLLTYVLSRLDMRGTWCRCHPRLLIPDDDRIIGTGR